MVRLIKLPSAQPEITDEQAIKHLQESGWMQAHDKQMYEMGLREQLADDSDSYDSLLPSEPPEIIRCKDCRHWIESRVKNYGQCDCDALMRDAEFFCKNGSGKNE